MFKIVVAAACAATGTALVTGDNNALTQMLLLDQLSGHHGYYGHHGGRGRDLLPLLALGGNGLTDANLNEYLLWDTVSHRDHRYESLPLLALTGNSAAAQEIFMLDHMSHGSHSNFLPMAVMSGSVAGFSDPMTQMWAMNRYGGGSSHDFNNLVTMQTAGIASGDELNSLWGLQQMQKGHNSIVPLMAATGQALPTDFNQLWMLDHASPASHSYYGRRHHGYSRHTPVRSYGHAAPVRSYGAPVAPARIQQFVPQAAAPVAQPVLIEEETVVEP